VGANDGASGVGVILEIVRQLAILKTKGEFVPSVQVVFFDCEDMGTPNHYTGAQREHRYEVLKAQAEEKGLAEDVKFYLDFFKFGCPPHGGFGIGIDRITMLIFNVGIKEAMYLFRGPDRLNP
jgi:aspartyl/asparaginyl-tRNA synthetase